MSAPLRQGTRVAARGDVWTVVSHVVHADCEAVRLSRFAPATGVAQRTLLVPFDRITPLATAAAPKVVRRRTWARGALRLIASSRPFGSLALAARAQIDLLPFQLEPALAMLRHGYSRVLIADEVGLGKTIQAGLILSEVSAQTDEVRAIVLAPAGLREQWHRELSDRFDLQSTIADAAWLAATARDRPPDLNPWGLPGIFIASFDLVKRPEVLRSLEDVTWDFLVVDEAHACGAGTARRAAAHALGVRSRRVVLLTATPPDGDPPQLTAMTSLGSLEGDPIVEFRRLREDAFDADVPGGSLPADVPARRSVLLQVRSTAAERRMHRLVDRYTALVWKEAGARIDTRGRLAAMVLRKRALSSAWSLASSVRRRLELLASVALRAEVPCQLPLPLAEEDPLEDEVPDAVIGAAGLFDVARECALLDEIEIAAREACRHESKVAFLLRFIRRAREPVIVFTEYRDTLAHLERVLRGAGSVPVLLHGGMPAHERAGVQRVFNEGDAVLLATDAASEGLNLHVRCRAVVHFELPWTPSRLQQRAGRVDRLGQRRTVHELLLVARHTAERVVLAPLVRRAHIARRGKRRRPDAIAALTESAVAAAIMEGRRIELQPSGSPPVARRIDLREEANREARRMELERVIDGAAGLAPPPEHVLLCRRKRTRDAALIALLRVTVEDAHGRLVHAVVVPFAVEAVIDRRIRMAAEMRALARELATEHFAALTAAAERALGTEVDGAVEQHRILCQALRERESAMLRALPSTARTLVQAGLFEQRTLRTAERQRRTITLLAEDASDRAHVCTAAEAVQRNITLAALLVRAR